MRRARALLAGGYLQGDEATDNRTRFAATTSTDDSAYFEVADHDGTPAIDLQVLIEAYDGP